MSKPNTLKPLAIALGTALTASLAVTQVPAAENPFAMTELSSGYKVASHTDSSTSEAAEEKAKEGKCGEGKCGEQKKAEEKAKEGKCGEGKCGSKK